MATTISGFPEDLEDCSGNEYYEIHEQDYLEEHLEEPPEPKIQVLKECRSCRTTSALFVRPSDLQRYQEGDNVQDIFPYLSPAEREMFISQYCGNCWDTIFRGDENARQGNDVVEETVDG